MRLIYPVITFSTSFATMAYAMVVASIISDFSGEEIISQCLTMGPYLMGLGLGSLYGDRISEVKYLFFLWRVEWISVILLPLIPLILIVSIFLFLHLSPMHYNLEEKHGFNFLMAIAGLFGVMAGILGGAQLPIIMKKAQNFKNEIILAINYMGPLLAGPFIVICTQKNIPLVHQVTLIAFVQMIGLIFIIGLHGNRKKLYTLLTIPLLCLAILNSYYGYFEHITIKSSYLGTRSSLSGLLDIKSIFRNISFYGELERVKTPYQIIDLFTEPPNPNLGQPGNVTLYLNRKPQFDLFFSDAYHQSMVYGGLNLMHETPKEVLILGGGDGLLLKELKNVAGIKHITMVELDQGIVDWSRRHHVLSKANGGVFDNLGENITVIIDDAITYLRISEKKYDLILIDFPFPNGHELAKLYSLEFYALVKKSMNMNSVVVIDLPVLIHESGQLASETRVILKTLAASGLKNPLLFGPYSSFLATKEDGDRLKFDYNKFPPNLSLSAKLNLVEMIDISDVPPEDWQSVEVNSMFWPRGF